MSKEIHLVSVSSDHDPDPLVSVAPNEYLCQYCILDDVYGNGNCELLGAPCTVVFDQDPEDELYATKEELYEGFNVEFIVAEVQPFTWKEPDD